MLAENLAGYWAIVHRCPSGELAATVARLLSERGARIVVTPPGLPDAWLPDANVKRIADDAAQFPAALDRVDTVVTACAVAVAETGAIVLDGGPDQCAARANRRCDRHPRR
ncbi:hypothetical protein ACWFRM_07485 [Streptomyces sp. NPDC055144]